MENQHKALLFDKLDENKVKCWLCPWKCIINEGKTGFCLVRKNIKGELYSLTYEQVCSVAADPIEKKPLFHFYPGTKVLSLGTYGCNMRCGHCQNWTISHDVKLDLTRKLPVEDLLKLCKDTGCRGVAWTYNEPIIWFEYTLEGAKLFKKNKLYTIYVTNGYITEEALDMLGPYLDCFRVDLKGFNNDVYKKLCKVKNFEAVLNATERAKKKWNMHVEVVTNLVPGINDDDLQLKDMANWVRDHLGKETPWHITRFFPYLEFRNLAPTPIETLEKARMIGQKAGLQFVYLGNVPGSDSENTYCPNCGNLAIKRDGYKIDQMNIKNGACANCQQSLNIRS